MFVFSWEAHLSENLPLLWLFTQEGDEKSKLAIILQPNGTFEFYEGEDGNLFPTMAQIVEITHQTGIENTLVVVNAQGVITTLAKSGDEFQDLRNFLSWTMIDPTSYDFEQIEQSMIIMRIGS